MEEFVTILSNFGFPVAVACYLLFRFEKKLDQLELTNSKLEDSCSKLSLRVEELLSSLARRRK